MESTNVPARVPLTPRRRAWSLLLQAYKTVIEHTESAVKKAGRISLVEYEVLSRLARAPEHRYRMIDIANMLLVSRSGVSRLVRRLEKSGYVRLEDSLEDRRVTYTVLTDKGRAIFQQTYDVFVHASEESLSQELSSEDLDNLNRILNKIIEGNGGLPELERLAEATRRQAEHQAVASGARS